MITAFVLLPDRCFLLLDSPSPEADAARLANWAVGGIPGMAIDESGLPKNGYDIAIEERDDSDESLGDVIEPDARSDVGSVVDAVVAARLRLLLPPPPPVFFRLPASGVGNLRSLMAGMR